ncbi:MAG: M23 family metallopeptidase [Candidatus Liptonbacteria bacterium]|nr:M23 family metallopeptidase [Candidatus Liptonbacteria bacterium]
MAVFLLAGLVAASFLSVFIGPVQGAEKGVWGGPARHSSVLERSVGGSAPQARWGNFFAAGAFVASQPRLGMFPAHAADFREELLTAQAQTTQPTMLNDFGTAPGFSPRAEFVSYKVVRGDTFSKIAAKFGVSLETVLRANPSVKASRLTVGETLQIPPMSGVVYIAKDGDTLESIADIFSVASGDIASVNRSVNLAMIGPGTRLIVPGATGVRATEQGKPLPVLKGYFIFPAAGFNWGRLHPVSAVDIAGVCGTPVLAAAEGLVIPDERYGEGNDGWNGGYGKFVLIEHPAGANIRTRYAHLKEATTEVGEYVKQGQQIGTMGDTGDASGCHVHFEVLGAANPFVK